jgi:4a-hydroxytetrahydrobiopterin dehydratase
MSFEEKSCKPCERGTPPLTEAEVESSIREIPGWSLQKGHLFKEFKFDDFKEAIGFVNRVADVAEREDHHPNIAIQYNKVSLDLWTHAINGLSENDFILASKVDKTSRV